jgi:thioredoxin 1
MSQLIELTTENFDSTISEGITMVDFWAPWCGPCRMIAPIIEEIASENETGATITKVNTDDQQELAQKYGVRSIPTILFFKDGEMVEQVIGAQSKQKFIDTIKGLQ